MPTPQTGKSRPSWAEGPWIVADQIISQPPGPLDTLEAAKVAITNPSLISSMAQAKALGLTATEASILGV